MTALTRREYRALATPELVSRMRRLEARIDSAMNDEAYLIDMFACQEICAVLSERDANPYDGDCDTPDSRDVAHDNSWSD